MCVCGGRGEGGGVKEKCQVGTVWEEGAGVEANDDFQRQFSPSCTVSKVV